MITILTQNEKICNNCKVPVLQIDGTRRQEWSKLSNEDGN